MNIVQFAKEEYSLNKAITSRDDILNVSRDLIRKQGQAAFNIRTVAAACQVSVGSIYNYFESKADLTAAAVESVWHDIFHISECPDISENFEACISWIFDCLRQGSEKYPGFFTLHSMSFLEEEKSDGKRRMNRAWEHIRARMHTVLIHDKNIRPDAFDEKFTPESFVSIIFSLIISALLQQNYDCSAVLELIRRTVY